MKLAADVSRYVAAYHERPSFNNTGSKYDNYSMAASVFTIWPLLLNGSGKLRVTGVKIPANALSGEVLAEGMLAALQTGARDWD